MLEGSKYSLISAVLCDVQNHCFPGERYILFTVTFSLLYNVTKFMEFSTVYQDVTDANNVR